MSPGVVTTRPSAAVLVRRVDTGRPPCAQCHCKAMLAVALRPLRKGSGLSEGPWPLRENRRFLLFRDHPSHPRILFLDCVWCCDCEKIS